MPERPLFLERASFRRRRLGDAARILPVVAAIAALAPVWWIPRQLSFAAGAGWLFGLWAVLILAIWALHRALLRAEAATLRAESAVAESLAPPAAAAPARPDQGDDDHAL
ncbi:hypothetical protein [Paracoccus salsus]|uniref:hypothetical protein n=1 Tax=Paracoccus salsus TaxID=2911061 RepID=UPI001F42E1D3|nr:hypothetical protein [Paracoccus salsus]MCF3972749.1 hypothetical protein [Paracoccus salsus]